MIVDEYVLRRKLHYTDETYGRKYRSRLKYYHSLDQTDEGAQYLKVLSHKIWGQVQYIFLSKYSELTI